MIGVIKCLYSVLFKKSNTFSLIPFEVELFLLNPYHCKTNTIRVHPQLTTMVALLVSNGCCTRFNWQKSNKLWQSRFYPPASEMVAALNLLPPSSTERRIILTWKWTWSWSWSHMIVLLELLIGDNLCKPAISLSWTGTATFHQNAARLSLNLVLQSSSRKWWRQWQCILLFSKCSGRLTFLTESRSAAMYLNTCRLLLMFHFAVRSLVSSLGKPPFHAQWNF